MKFIPKIYRQLAVLGIIVSLLTGCGFQLRGTDGAPIPTIENRFSISIQTAIPGFKFKLAESLRRREFRVIEQNADYRVDVFDEHRVEDDYELFSDKYELDTRTLHYRIGFRLTESGQEESVLAQTISLTTDYSRIGSSELARDTAMLATLERVRREAADMLADRLVDYLAEK